MYNVNDFDIDGSLGGREWLSAVASSCLRYGRVVCGSEWLSAVAVSCLR